MTRITATWLQCLAVALDASDVHEVTQLLMQQPATRDTDLETPTTRLKRHRALHKLLLTAVERGDVAVVSKMLESECVTLTSASDDLCTAPLAVAVTRRNCEMVRVLLAHGAQVNIHEQQQQQTPLLTIAVGTGCIEIVAELLARGADPNAAHAHAPHAVRAAVEHAHRDSSILQMLLAHGAHSGFRDHRGVCALHVAATSGSLDAIAVLAAHGADVDARDGVVATPLHCAATMDSSGAVKVLAAEGASIDAVDARGRTAMHFAAMHSSPHTLKVLLARGASPVERDCDGFTPLCRAARFGKRACVDALVTVDEVLYSAFDPLQAGALDEAVAQGRADVVAQLLNVVSARRACSAALQPAFAIRRALAITARSHHVAIAELLTDALASCTTSSNSNCV